MCHRRGWRFCPRFAASWIWSAALCIGAAAQAQPAYQITQIGLTGPNYSYDVGSQLYQYSYGAQLNGAAQITGLTHRYDAAGDDLGADAWFYDGTQTFQIGLTGPDYSYLYTGADSGTFADSTVQEISDAGQVTGETERFNAAGTALGADAWIYSNGTTRQIGLLGTNYSFAYTGAGGGTAENSTVSRINDSGEVLGYSARYNADGVGLGSDAWIFNGTTTQQIGLTGTIYSFAYTGTGGGTVEQTNDIQHLNNVGIAVGGSARFNSDGQSLGQDSWIYNGTTTQQIGLTGVGYEYALPKADGGGTYQSSNAGFLNSTNQVAGTSIRYAPGGVDLGQDAWLSTGSITQQIGLTGVNYGYGSEGGIFEDSGNDGLNNAGQVIGFSERFNNSAVFLGQDTWISNGTTTQQIGLTGTGYSYANTSGGGGTYEQSEAFQITDAGQAIGNSERYNASGTDLGEDAWVFNGTTTFLVGLTGTNYGYATSGGTYQNSVPLGINPSGQAIGWTYRYDSSGDPLGRSAWFYDPTLDKSLPLEFSFDPTGNCNTFPEVLTSNGDVLGYYYDYFQMGSLSSFKEEAFLWTESTGEYDVGALVNGGLTAAGWANLYTAGAAVGLDLNGFPTSIFGDGELPNSAPGSNTFYLLTELPEPTAIAPAAAVLLILKRRRGRAAAITSDSWSAVPRRLNRRLI